MIPRWSVYPALVVLTSFPFLGIPEAASDDPHAGRSRTGGYDAGQRRCLLAGEWRLHLLYSRDC